MDRYSCKQSNVCPICGAEVSIRELFCEKCGMRIYACQQQTVCNKVNRPNQEYSSSADIIQPTRYGTRALSELPDLKKVIDDCRSSVNSADLILCNLIDDYRERILNSISDVIEGDLIDTETFESLGISFIEERDFGLDRCTVAAKEIFNLGVMMSWANLSAQERKEISGVYAKEVAEAFELKLYVGVVYEDLEEGVLGYNNGNGQIHLSNKLMEPINSPFTIIDTITHELRHQYQSEAIMGYHNIPEDVAREWAIAFQIYRNDTNPCCYNPWGYHYSPIEIDARYAGETVVRNITHDLFNIKSAERKSDIDLQQLKKRLINDGYSGVMLNHTIENLLKLDGKAFEMLHSWVKYGATPEFDNIEGLNSSYLREYFKMKESAIILSYGLLMNNPQHNSRYLKSMLSLQHGRLALKANLRSRYIFYLERDYENAKDAIYYGNRTIYDKLEWYGSWSNINGHDYVWRVDLYDNLTQEELEYAVGHIREHNGLYYKD